MPKEPRRERRRHRSPALWVASAAIATALAVVPHLTATRPWVVPAVQALVPVACVAVLVAAIVLLLLTRLRGWPPASLLVLGALAAMVPIVQPAPPSPETHGQALTVMSLNAQYAQVDAAQLAAALREHEVSVLVLVEADENLVTELGGHGVLDRLPHRTAAIPESTPPAGGAVILSAHPLREEGSVPRFADYRHFDQPVAVIEAPGLGPVRVVAVHPVPPAGADFVPSWNQTLRGLDGWQAELVEAPLVLAGDFNASRAHPRFRSLAQDFHAAAAVDGPLQEPTWPLGSAVPPFTAIDHILSRGLIPADYDTVTLPGTDHRGLVTTLVRPG